MQVYAGLMRHVAELLLKIHLFTGRGHVLLPILTLRRCEKGGNTPECGIMPGGVRIREVQLWFLPVKHRIPLKFGAQTVWQVTCARVRVVVENARGYCAEGWGETPLSVAWVWPSPLGWEEREKRMKAMCVRIARELVDHPVTGHPMEIADTFQNHRLHALLSEDNAPHAEPMPHLAALVCHSPFDLATFDAFANLHDRPVFATLNAELLEPDLAD